MLLVISLNTLDAMDVLVVSELFLFMVLWCGSGVGIVGGGSSGGGGSVIGGGVCLGSVLLCWLFSCICVSLISIDSMQFVSE